MQDTKHTQVAAWIVSDPGDLIRIDRRIFAQGMSTGVAAAPIDDFSTATVLTAPIAFQQKDAFMLRALLWEDESAAA